MNPNNQRNKTTTETGTIPKSNFSASSGPNIIRQENSDNTQNSLPFLNDTNNSNVSAKTKDQSVRKNVTSNNALLLSRLPPEETFNSVRESGGASNYLGHPAQASLAEKITIPSLDNDDVDYQTNNPGDSIEAQNTYMLNPLVLSDKLSQLQQKLQSMRVVQQRLDRLNPHFEENSSEQPCTINNERAINSHDQSQLMVKLQELELKKENMETMIKTLRNSRQEDVNEATPSIPLHDMIMGPISVPNQNTLLNQMDLLTANRPHMQSMEKTSLRSDNEWSYNPVNNVALNGDQRMFSIPSPSLSMLDNLRALEVSHEGMDDVENRRLEHGAKDYGKAILAQPMHYNQNLLLEQRENVQFLGARQRHDNESNFNNSTFSPINRLSQNQTTLNSKQKPKPDSNLQYDYQQTKGTHNRVEFLHSKPNIGHIRKENRSTVCMDQSDIARQQECMSGNIYHQCTSAPGTCAASKIAPICDRIKALEDEINSLYGEVSSISRATGYSRAKSNVKDREFEAKTTRNNGEANFYNSSDSSYVMLHNSSGGARLMQKDTQLTSSNNRNESENTMCKFESLLFMSLQRQENLVQEQQKEISNLKNCISSSTARLTVVEGDVDGMNAVLRSLIDIIDQKNQHSSERVEVPSFVQPATRSSMIPLHEDQAVANHIFSTHNTQTNHSTKLHDTQHPDSSVTSRTCPRIESGHSIQNEETSFCRSTQNEASISRLSSNPVQKRPLANKSCLPTDANLDIAKTYQGFSPNNLNRFQNSTRPYQSTSPVVNFPATCQPPNEKNIFQEERNVENMQQYFDDEPWRHFEIDMDNGLGNLNLGRLSLNENASAIGNNNLFVSGPRPNSNNIVRPSGTTSPFNNVNTNTYNSISQQHGYVAYLPTHDRFPTQVDHTSLLEGIQNLIEQPHQAGRFARIDDNKRLSLRPSETNGEEFKINNDALAIRHKDSVSQKHSIKPMISTPKSNSNEITHSSIMNSFELLNPSATTSALNNQVPPGRRANNYWDNFKSYSRPNRLEITPSTSQSVINPTARPTAAVGAVFTNGSQRVATSIANRSPMIAQVPPRQQSMLSSNIVHPIQIVPRTSQESNQSVPEVAEVSSLTQSIVGHVNNLIRQAEANPERLQELLEEIQTAGNPSSIPFNAAYQEQPSDSPNTNRQDSSISQGETGLPNPISDNAVNKLVCSRVKPDLIETQHLPNGYLRKSERLLIIDDNSSQSHEEELVGRAEAPSLATIRGAGSSQQLDVAVPKNLQRNGNPRERGPGRVKISTVQVLPSSQQVASVAGHALPHRNANLTMTASGAVRKEKSRVGLVFVNDQNVHEQPTSMDASKFEQYPVDISDGLASDSKTNGNATANFIIHSEDSDASLDCAMGNLSKFTRRASQSKQSTGPCNDNASLRKTNVNDKRREEKQFDVSSALVKPLQNKQNQSIGPSEGFQCEMAEADQASICDSPQKNQDQSNDTVSSSASNNGSFQEVKISMLPDQRIQATTDQTLFAINVEASRKERLENHNDKSSADGSHTDMFGNEECPNDSLVLRRLPVNSSSTDLERRKAEEENASALTVNAIVEEILNSPTNSGRNSPNLNTD